MENEKSVVKFGIDNTKKLTGLVVDFFNQGVESFGDGFQTSDLFAFMDEASALAVASPGFKNLPNEIKDLDANEAKELVAFVSEKAASIIKNTIDDPAKEAAVLELSTAITEWIVSTSRVVVAIQGVRAFKA